MTSNRASVRCITALVYLLFSTVGALPNTDTVQGDEGRGRDLILLTDDVFRINITEAERYANILSLHAHSTSKNGDINETLAQQDGDINVTLAHWAAQISVDILRSLESTGVNLNTTDEFNRTLLITAVLGNDLRVVKYLVEEKRFDVEAKCSFFGYEYTPLALAVQDVKRIAIMKYLVDERKADIYSRDSTGQTLLHLAAAASNLVALKYLIDEKNMSAHLEDGDHTDYSVALAAVRDGCNLDVLKYLIEEKHVNTSIRSIVNYNLLHIAAENFNLAVVKYLVEEQIFDIMEPANDGSTVYTVVKRAIFSMYRPSLEELEKGKEVLDYLEKRMVDKLRGV